MSEKEYFEKLLAGVEQSLKEEFLSLKQLNEENFSEYKDQFSEVFWKLYEAIAQNIDETSPLEQKFFLRLGLVDPRYLTKDDLERIKECMISQPDDTFYYVDEWLVAVKNGKINPSTFEEVIQEQPQEKRTYDYTWIEKEYERKLFERNVEEEKLKDLVKGVQGKGPYTKGVYVIFDEITKSIGKLKKLDNDIKNLKETLDKAREQAQAVQRLPKSNGKSSAFTEPLVIRQMVKKTVGKLGIQYPALTSNYLREINAIFSKKKSLKLFEELKLLDPTTLRRTIKGTEVFMSPFVILVPGYGESGFCWEPIEGLNIYGRGRIVVPIFSRKGLDPFYQAFGEYRWKLEKELSFGRWMEEGLTGEYYQYLEENKLKGQPAEYFVKDYILWLSKEANGIQKLDKAVREIFWKYLPFDDSVKEKLSKVSYIYQQLWERDLRKRQRDQH
ncbi:hypothetical protein QQE94_06175 [Fervidobacterium pennivorans subsp. shakshaketiis]|uniref:hypothetical protein n=1 Tax=Fervidobacterium pennivorans TaxID=93466 RepID=UPI00355B0EBE